MIKSLDLFNFQSHRETHIDFSNGINMIVGPSDSGKSGIRRGIEWVVFNRPSGDQYRSWWGGETRGIITLDDGREVHRVKDKSKNLYILKTPMGMGMKEQEFKAMGTDVPDLIREALNLPPLNFQGQMDPPGFLLGMNSGEVARVLNKVASLDGIDTSFKQITSWKRENDRDLRKEKEDLESITEDLREFENLDEQEKDFQELEEMERERIKLNLERISIGEICDEIERLPEFEDLEDQEKDLRKLEEMEEGRFKLRSEADSIGEICDEIKELEDELEDLPEVADGEERLGKLLKEQEKSGKLHERTDLIKGIILDIDKTESFLGELDQRIEEAQTRFDEEMPEICPLCEKEV